jgi:cell division protein FtsB
MLKLLSTWLGRLLLAAVMAGALAYIPYRVYGSDGYVKYRKLSGQLQDLQGGNQALVTVNADLRREIDDLKTDPEAVRRVARDDLGMVGQGEIVIKIETPPPLSAAEPEHD